jgi:hypothetical protein
MVKLPSPFDSDPQQFIAVVAMLSELLEAGKVRLRVTPLGGISYNIKGIDLEAAVAKHEIELAVARTIINEISVIASSVLRAGLERSVNQIVERPSVDSRARLSEDEKSEVKSVLVQKFQIVENRLVTERAKQKFHAAKASKHETLTGIRWQIIERKYDQSEGEKAGGSAALMRFEITSRPKIADQPEFDIISSVMLGMFGVDPPYNRNFLIECDEDDLDDLIDTLNDAKLRLAQERGR